MQTIDEYVKAQPPIVVAGVERPYRQADLARDMGIHPNMLTKYKANGWMIYDGRLWSPKQQINTTEGK